MQIKDLIEALSEMEDIFTAAGATKAADDVEDLLTIFDGHQDMSAEEFFDEMRKLYTVKSKSKTRATQKQANDLLVERYVRRLNEAALERDVFSNVMSELKSDGDVRKAEVDRIQFQYVGGREMQASKRKGIEAIEKWFNQRRYQAAAIEEAGKVTPW